jgi:UDP-GlcNAc:undecaprenyl-phosphate GlcNAc-1-phosphate transferase
MLVLLRAAPSLDLVDSPGGRKSHAGPIPLVGGLAILVSLLACAFSMGLASRALYFVCVICLASAVGVWDDIHEIRPRIKFAVEIVGAAIMVWGAEVQLTTVGDLVGRGSIGLWVFAIPLTVFAIIGVVNSFNMIDGADGLGGTLALVAFGWYALVANIEGLSTLSDIGIIFCGATAGFLVFNLRLPWQPRARAFLGDAGSIMLGFSLGWFAIDLTQGPGRTFPPIAALWVLLLPLADCVSLMARRLKARKSPFVADNHHIHHYLIARGFSHGQTLAILVGASATFGAVGFFGWRLGVPEPVLFWPFFFGYFAYHFWIQRAWRALESKR